MIKNSINTSASAAFVNIAYAWWLAHWLAAQCTVFWIRTAAEYEQWLDLPTWAVAHWRLAGAGAWTVHWAVAPGLRTGGGCRWREDRRREEGGGGPEEGGGRMGAAAYLEGGGRPTAAASVSGGSAAVCLAVWRLEQACWLKAH
jgi:hypothetical protein